MMKLKSAGFTLMEMLVALALMSVLLTVTLGTGVSLLKGEKHVHMHKETVQDIYATLNLLEKDLNTFLTGFKSHVDGFEFITLTQDDQKDVKRSDQLLVRYSFTFEDEKVHVHRQIQDAFVVDEVFSREPLITINQFLLAYINESGKSKTTWKEVQAPAALSIQLTDTHGNLWNRTIPIMVRDER